jgi:hypothetical protein
VKQRKAEVVEAIQIAKEIFKETGVQVPWEPFCGLKAPTTPAPPQGAGGAPPPKPGAPPPEPGLDNDEGDDADDAIPDEDDVGIDKPTEAPAGEPGEDLGSEGRAAAVRRAA